MKYVIEKINKRLSFKVFTKAWRSYLARSVTTDENRKRQRYGWGCHRLSQNVYQRFVWSTKWGSLRRKVIDWYHTCLFWYCRSTAKLVKWFVWQTVRVELDLVVTSLTPSLAHKLWYTRNKKICYRTLQSASCASFKTVTKQPIEMVWISYAMYLLVNLTNSAFHSI